MAFNNENNQPGGANRKITSSDFLPKFYRTNANQKFLQATLDQLIQPGQAEKIEGYFGRKTAKAYKSTDSYIQDVSSERESYQLEPTLVSKDEFNNITFYKDYNDYVNQLKVFGADTRDNSVLNSQESYSWNPHIDWDKFVNFREYYWLPNGPQLVDVRGQAKEVVSTYTVTTVVEDDNTAYVFNDGFTRNPSLQLYRGQTYRFEVDVPGHPIAFAISRTFTPGAAILVAGTEGIRSNGLYDGALYDEEDANYDLGDFIVLPSGGSVTFEEDENVSTIYPDGIRKFGEEGDEVATVYLEKGTIEFTIPDNAPDRLYYISKNNIDTSGYVKIANIEENTFLDIENDILGKKTYKSANGVEFTNGLKIQFQGDVTPNIYESDNWYVEGVGDKITLINEKDLIIPAAYSEDNFVPFDSENFDTLPFSRANSFTRTKDYIVINRNSLDRNAWSRYNKWFHKDVIQKSAEYNNLPNTNDEQSRAKRPIIEFERGLKLNNNGVIAKKDVDLVDTVTTDVFSTIEGRVGYRVDKVELAENMRVLFTADNDILVNGKIYIVKFIKIGNNRQINLVEAEDSVPNALETILVTQGNSNAGKSYFYNGTAWKLAQEKTEINQAPLFEVFDISEKSFSDVQSYNATTFKGTKIFSYKVGTGANDPELGFPLSYRNLNNSGDIVFNFDLNTDTFTYELGTELNSKSINPGFLKKYKNATDFSYTNGLSSKPTKTIQKVIRQYTVDEFEKQQFEIDVYEKAGTLQDLRTYVFVNNKLVKNYSILKTNQKAFVNFNSELDVGDNIIIKTTSSAKKNVNGYYDFPINFERNPLNEDFTSFTLGEVIDHVDTMIEDIQTFSGVYPGTSNLRDLGDINPLGKRFVKHSGPVNLANYHITNKNYNLITALNHSRREYARFKRNFIESATGLGVEPETKQHVDLILKDLNKDKQKTEPYYFSDSLAYQSSNVIEYTVLDTRTQSYALTEEFNLLDLTNKSVNVYLNNIQLVHEVDYNFSTPGFVNIFADFIAEGDAITIYEYSSTDGSFIPPTPTKLGLYPKFEPAIIYDDTFRPEAGESAQPDVPYKIYAQSEEGYNAAREIGWFYPLYTNIDAAKNKDIQNGGTGSAHKHMFVGANIILYMPDTGATHAGVETTEFDAFPFGQPMVKGHDGSFVRCYYDYRDKLLLELEKRIFNNIKNSYDSKKLNIHDFIGGNFRKSEFTREQLDSVLLRDFADWLTFLDNDYTDHYFYLRQDEFTFNYSSMKSYNGKTLPGYWRGIYHEMFDTDKPHTHPWEMLGFTIKPTWWNTVYGPAPYTSDNLILWEDIQEGKIAEPGNIRYNSQYARPDIVKHIPVDQKGMLRSPLEANIPDNFLLRPTTNNFSFGDWAPVENAWRKSSEYPFAVITAMVLNKPAKTIGIGYDLSRIQRNFAGQYIYNETSKTITLKDLVLPNTTESNKRVMTSGLVNYVSNLISSNILKVYTDYENELKSLTNQLGLKLGGFTDKKKVNVILDSRSIVDDRSQDSVYIPEENYEVFLNTSSPTDLVTYSGVYIEKVANGFNVRGYSKNNPYFDYYQPLSSSKSVDITVGGIGEVTTEWESRKIFGEGEVVENVGKYYRVRNNFTSGASFDTENLAILPSIPIVGGKTANFKKNFSKQNVSRVPYGHRFANSQEVIDFLLGYGEYLKDIGFEFNNTETGAQIDDWNDSAKEFLFWTTQGWASGTVISLSPAANRLEFDRDYHVVDDLNDPFYGYNIFDANADPLDIRFNSILRDQNSFGIEVVGTDAGLYHVALPIVQKEHVILFDNQTVFNDILYQPSTGYRQERLKINAYRTDNWQGGFNVPGFIFDDAKYTLWTEYNDYKIGDLVKHREYYYVAKRNLVGSDSFNNSDWYRLSEEPEKKLLTNFDYRINQFMDFYDLDSAGFDETQQELAQHLVGYQKRQYLANIINDDVSQFKFYNGFIQDKGTMNSVRKLFDSIAENQEDKIELYEEWAVQLGRYGSIDNEKQLEYRLTDSKLEEAPQIFKLKNVKSSIIDKIYNIYPDEVFDKPDDYNHEAAFPTVAVKEYLKTGGYVNEDHVTFIAYDSSELFNADINRIDLGAYIWLVETGADDWTVYQIVDTNVSAIELNPNSTEFDIDGNNLVEVTLDKWTNNNINKNDFVGIINASDYNIEGIYKVEKTDLNKIYFNTPVTPTSFAEQKFAVVKLRSVRVGNTQEINDIIIENQYDEQRFWVNNFDNGSWAVLENNPAYSQRQAIANPSDWDSTDQEFGRNIAATENNRTLVIGAPGDENGKFSVYQRPRENSNFVINQQIEYTQNNAFDNQNARFADSIDISPDGEYIVAGLPKASNIKTKLAYKNDGTGKLTFDFQSNASYVKGDIVRYRESLWQALRTINAQTNSQDFSTFDNYQNIINDPLVDSTNTVLVVTGDPSLENNYVDHILLRAPIDMYLGTKSRDFETNTPGDSVKLVWNQRSFAYPTLDNYQPFDGTLNGVTADWLGGDPHEIIAKVDAVIEVPTFISLPEIGDFVTTVSGRAEVVYRSTSEDSAVIYVKDVNGELALSGELFVDDKDFIGLYTLAGTFSPSTKLGGFWLFKTYNTTQLPSTDFTSELDDANGFTYLNRDTFYDVGRGLTISDVIVSEDAGRNVAVYYNIQDDVGAIGAYVNNGNRVSFITQLSYRGDPTDADGQDGAELTRISNQWAVRVGKQYSDTLEVGDSFELEVYQQGQTINYTDALLSEELINSRQTIYDIWDGYIDCDLSRFDALGFPFQPQGKFYHAGSDLATRTQGDIIVDQQTSSDGSGGLSVSSLPPTSAAEVMYVQRNFNSLRLYVKLLDQYDGVTYGGDFSELNNIGRYELKRLANDDIRSAGDVDRTFATIANSLNDVVVGNTIVGKLLIFESDTNFVNSVNFWDETPVLQDIEYYFYNESVNPGIELNENPPYSLNKDYRQLYNLPVDEFGLSNGLSNAGVIAIYRRKADNTYELQKTLASLYSQNDRQFGQKVKIVQTGKYYTLLVSSKGNGTKENPGEIEIFRHGIKATDDFVGDYQVREYVAGEIVYYKDQYYRSIRPVPTTVTPTDSVYWNNISWQYGKDVNYRGDWDNEYSYALNNIVTREKTKITLGGVTGTLLANDTITFTSKDDSTIINKTIESIEGSSVLFDDSTNVFDDFDFTPKSIVTSSGATATNITSVGTVKKVYKAVTNISALAPFNTSDWELLDSRIDYVGYLPNLTRQSLYDETIFDPATDVVDFSQTFDISDDSEVLIVKAGLTTNDSTTTTRLIVYRATDNKFVVDQVIDSPSDSIGWGDNVSLNPQGDKFAVSAALSDEIGIDKGLVYVYSLQDGNFVLSQTLTSPQNEIAEKFGSALDFGKENLLISSLNGDQVIPTTFDNDVTTFDGKFTNFANVKLDKGVVYVYENLNNQLVYAESLIYPSVQTVFGENLYSVNNHIYVGIPLQSSGTWNSELNTLDGYRGQIVDFRKDVGSNSWTRLDNQVLPVDLDKITGVTLYNQRTNSFITRLDYIDPLQGKIAGPAEQEIDYKVGFDPASYNTGLTNDFLVDPKTFWGKEHVGETWWSTNTARFTYSYKGSLNDQKRDWNKLIRGSSIDVFEWVESDYVPQVYDELADTDNGLRLGISGQSLYGNTRYSTQLVYDKTSQNFRAKYYFWVQNKRTIPTDYKPKRKLNCVDIENLIENPRLQGYKYVSFLGKNTFILNNCNDLIQGDDVVLQVRYKNDTESNINTHNEYQIISEGLESSIIHPDIERKWYDSLIGFDTNLRKVPDISIPENKRYGVQNRPRQGMFKNRYEALKQTVERINLVLQNNLLIDSYDLSRLSEKEAEPVLNSGLYDQKISNFSDLRFVSTNKVQQAEIDLVISNGRIISANIINPGRGYKVPPSFDLEGPGSDAIISMTINNLGQVTAVNIEKSGSGYLDTTKLIVRPFSVLVQTNENVYGKWTIYSWNGTQWFVKRIQDYDVSTYWEYEDWYAPGYNQFTTINYTVKGTYLLSSLGDNLGDIVKVESTGSGGWLLLHKVKTGYTEDYTQNYNVVGRENGTLYFKDSLYNYSSNAVGFDNRSFDSFFYDNNPVKELRIILETLRDNIFTGNLAAEYNNLFFVGVRFALAEQPGLDWIFKTSFVKAKYNVSELRNDITFNSDNLQSFEDYLKEVKPYKTKIREYIDVYDKVENTNTSMTDFDLPPFYSVADGKIISNKSIVLDNTITGNIEQFEEYPRKHFIDNIGYEVTEIKIKDGGSGYSTPPQINIVGDAQKTAKAVAYIGYGKITSIKITDPGRGYLTRPTVEVQGSQTEDGTPARLSVILGNSPIRTAHLRVKFDRFSKSIFIEELTESQNFTGNNLQTIFDLEWPMDVDRKKVSITVDGVELLNSKYTYNNVDNDDKTYTRQNGRITFVNPPAQGEIIQVSYSKPISMLSAQDRIHHFYEPTAGMLGKDFSQLMSGIDYGGVEVKSIDFTGPSGWDSVGWYTDTWDTFDNTYEDEVFIADGSTIFIELSAPLENGTSYNVYKGLSSDINLVRIDDPNFGTPQQVNDDAIIQTIVGDGTTTVIDLDTLGVSFNDGETLIVRKTTSDGSIVPDPTTFDTQLSGGDLPYVTAKGVNAEEILVDGDGFVNPVTHAGPEELVPGLVTDALDIKVYTRDSDGTGTIYSQSYITSGGRTEYSLGNTPSTNEAVFVKLDNILLDDSSYTIDWKAETLTLNTAPADNQELNIISQSLGTNDLLDYGKYTTDGSTTDVVTTVDWLDDASVSASVNGEPIEVIVFNSNDEGYSLPNAKVGIRFPEVVQVDSVINYAVFSSSAIQNFSRVLVTNFTGDGTRTSFTLDDVPFTQVPLEHKILVKVDNKILNPGYNIKYTIPQNNQRTYNIETFQQPIGSLDIEEIKVFLNGVEIFAPVDWRYDVANASILLTDETGQPGDVVEIFAIADGEYAFGYLNGQGAWIDTPGTLHFDTAPTTGQNIEIYQFSNHDFLDIERINYDVVDRSSSPRTTTFTLLKSGIVRLRSTAVDEKYVWVSKNGELLTPSVDYYVNESKNEVRLTTAPAENDVIDVLHFTAPVGVEKFAYRQFKDMLNRTHYKRLDKAVVKLSQPLNYYDQRIEVTQGDLLAEPNKGNNLPGIIWINGERIEYFIKEDNTLRQIRRGTLGTGIKDVHETGSEIYDQNISKTVPYQDTTISKSFIADGLTDTFEPGFTIESINAVEVFVAGKRLRKVSLDVFDPAIALDSPEGDTESPAEFTVENDIVTINTIPANETQVMVVKKVGSTWTSTGEQLALTENSIARFLRAGTSELPE